MSDAECIELLQWALPRLRLRWRGYRRIRRQVCHRVRERIAELGVNGFLGYRARLEADPAEYSLALLWDLDVAPTLPGRELEIVATDTHPEALARARRAVYGQGSLREIPATWRPAFEPHPEGRLLPEVRRRRVRLLDHDLEREPPPGRFDLVLARNSVFTYFVPDLQVETLERLAAAIDPGGFLVIGEREEMPLAGVVAFDKVRRGVYRRR